MRDLADGELAERRVQDYLNQGSCNYEKAVGKVKTHDLKCLEHGELVEIKNDRKAPKTGNICLEKALFATTHSQTIVYVVEDNAYVFDLTTLWTAIKSLAAEGKTVFKLLGDRNANPAILVKMPDILPFAQLIQLKGE